MQSLCQNSQSRDDLVTRHLSLVKSIAGRFANRGEPVDDLRQVGYVGLIKAADRFDSARGVAFATYGYAKITGEIRRYFRDKCWAIRIPRKMQELKCAIDRLKETVPADRAPDSAEIGSMLSTSEEKVRRAGELSSVYRPLSLDAVVYSGGSPVTFLETLGSIDPDIERAEIHSDIVVACNALTDHERSIVRLRYYEEMTQTAIGAMLGKSQMYVSRVEKSALRKLRAGHRPSFTVDEALPQAL